MPPAVVFAQLPTEQPNPRSRALDRLSIPQLLRVMNREDATVSRAVARALPQLTSAVRLTVERLETGGRLMFIGAGTSGRLGVIEAAECPPTFNTPPQLVQSVIAGGHGAVFRSREGAEDDGAAARIHIRRRVRRGDVVVGIAASGITPFVSAGLAQARRQGAATILITCNTTTLRRDIAEIIVAAAVGPELITGSTRLKAGTATKLMLNMLTVATMVRLGKVYDHWMVDVRPTSRKLGDRAIRIIQTISGVSRSQAAHLLTQAHGQTKVALLMACRGISVSQAHALLRRHRGLLRPILG